MKKRFLGTSLCALLLAFACGTSAFAMTKNTGAGKESAFKQTEPAEVKAAADNGKEDDTAKAESSEKDASKKKKAKKKTSSKKKETSEKKDASEKNDASQKKENEKQKEAEARQKFDEEIAGDYVPEGFSPYGDYLLLYDSGYPVKTRLSPAGMTFYWGSEEFNFRPTKDLPDMTKNTAHLLFNTLAPMGDPGDETFPFAEGYVLQISLNDGSYYEVYSSQLDLHGRIFVRDLFEAFRVKWEGKF